MADDMDDLLRQHHAAKEAWYRNRETRLTGAARPSPPVPTAVEVEDLDLTVARLRQRAREHKSRLGNNGFYSDYDALLDESAASLLERLAGKEVERG